MSNLIIEDLNDSILKITLNNPSQQNTLSLQFIKIGRASCRERV